MSGQAALGIAGFAGAADVWPDLIGEAGCRRADLAFQGGTSVAVAVHARVLGIHIGWRNRSDVRIAVGCEGWPAGVVRTAGATGAAAIGLIVQHRGRLKHRCPARNPTSDPDTQD